MTPYNKAAAAAICAAAAAALAALPLATVPPTWAIVATAALGPITVFFVPNKPRSRHRAIKDVALPVVPKQTPGVPLIKPTTAEDERLG